MPTAPAKALAKLDPEVRAMLREDLPRQLDEIDKLIEAEQAERAAAVAHTVAGTAAFCRLEALHMSAAMLESDLKNNMLQTDAQRTFRENAMDVLNGLQE